MTKTSAEYTPARRGATIHVSALGDNTDGSSWARAYTSVQKALGAIPDDLGGHRVVIRPDTYMEGNLHPAHPGAKGSYNTFEVDWDGSLGSGRSGYAVIDASDAQRGMQSIDWWGFPRCTPDFSGVVWDRWILRHVYATGGDGGLFWDLPFKTDEFSIVVEDSVGIGRAFGGGAGHVIARPGEPMVWRRCCLWALDWWGDTAGAYVRAENTEPRDEPDFFFEDCTIVGPQCALKSGNPGFSTYSHVDVRRCRLIALNFSQPHGTPTDGIIQSVMEGKYLHVDLEDTTLMGYTVFGVRHEPETAGDIGYTARGCVRAYVQFQQDVPEGIHSMGQWPADVFDYVKPPSPYPQEQATHPRPAVGEPELVAGHMCELSPIVWRDRLVYVESMRPGGDGQSPQEHFLRIRDAQTDEEISRFAQGHNLHSVIVEGDTMYVYSARHDGEPWNDVTMFASSDLLEWRSKVVITQEPGEKLFNTSVCRGSDGYVMAYESNDRQYPAFTTKFAVSDDLETWRTLPDAVFGTDRYAACPCLRYENGWYYQLYLERRTPVWRFETYIARSKDLVSWEQSAMNPVVAPSGLDEGINTSDPELLEHEGRTWLYYSAGDQRTWMNMKRIPFDGPQSEFLESWFDAPSVPERATVAADAARAEERREWFNEAKFGLFIHWGLYSLHGKNDGGAYVSWSMEQESIPVEEYAPYADRFDPTQFDATRWMEIAKSAGMRYVVFTSKHHEGFSMFETELCDYSSEKRAPGRDFARELVEAARAAGLKIGFYYSFLDWYHPDYSGDLDKYVREFAHPQVAEICTNYGPIDVVWFDGEWDHPAETWHSEELVRTIRRLQPNAVINDRLGKDERGTTALSDFYTREQPSEIDEETGFEVARNPWEACMTIGKSWGFRHDDAPFLSVEELIRYLSSIACRGGNVLLNVGPTPEGEIPEHFVERLGAIGRWLDVNGSAIYGTYGMTVGEHACTAREDRLYVHLTERPGDALTLSGLNVAIRCARLLGADGELTVDDAGKRVVLPADMPDEAVSIVELELDGSPTDG